MAWVDVKKEGSPETHRVTEEAYVLIFKEQGYSIVSPKNGGSTTKTTTPRVNSQPKADTAHRAQNTGRKRT